MSEQKKGRLICVGTGLRMAAHMTPISLSHIKNADVVIAAIPNVFTKKWLQGEAKEFICVLDYYKDVEIEGKTRRDTYRRMADTILEHVRAGKTVCAAFYGHPGIFACISHMAIADARAEGYRAHMEPGVSAEDYLVADIGIDPAFTGMQAFETTQFMLYQRKLDPTTMLILWQPGLAGELTLKRFDTTPARLQLLVDKLASLGYPNESEAILYEAATLPFEKTRIDRIRLGDLPTSELKQITTLVVLPAQKLELDQDMAQKLKALN